MTTTYSIGWYEAKGSDGKIYSLFVWSDGSADVYVDDAEANNEWMNHYPVGFNFRTEPRFPEAVATRFAAARKTIIEQRLIAGL